MDSDISRALSQICVRHGDATWHVEQALAAYKPIKTLLKVVGTEVAPAKPVTSRFVKPDYEQAANEFWASGKFMNHITAQDQGQAFVDFYQAKNWMVGKTKMKDWKAAVRNWIRRMSSETHKPNNRPAKQSFTDKAVSDTQELFAYADAIEVGGGVMGQDGNTVPQQVDVDRRVISG
jgi:hypothetical protein